MTLAIDILLSPLAHIVHQRSRLMISKRIVEYDGARYVLHRFRRYATFMRFTQLIEQMVAAAARRIPRTGGGMPTTSCSPPLRGSFCVERCIDRFAPWPMAH